MSATKDLVLVTGGSGFVGSHTVLAAVKEGYRVRTTVRSPKKGDDIRQMLRNGGATEEQVNNVEFVVADLLKDDGWTEACAGCKYVHHVASPFPISPPKREDDLIIPARDGTLRIMRAAKAAGTVKRVVITSSLAAIAYGQPDRDYPFSEKDWTDLTSGITVPAYQKSKTIAEKAAWDFVKNEGNGLELATVNPVGILGPVLSASNGTSIEIVVQMLQGKVPMLPKLYVGWVDVRDVALLHMRAAVEPKANGQRFLACAGEISMKDTAVLVKEKLGSKASKVGTRELPNFVVKFASLFSSDAAMIVGELDKVKRSDCTNAKTILGWQPIPLEEAIVSAAESCIKYGLVK